MAPSTTARDLLRHSVATLAYRAEKVLRDAPASFAGARLASSTRTPLEIVSHMGDLVEWGQRMAQGEYVWSPQPTTEWQEACDRFFRGLLALDDAVASSPLEKYPADVIFQGPIADALTHVGQLALIRGAAGVPIRPESYAQAEIQPGRVGRDQAAARKEFQGDASARRA